MGGGVGGAAAGDVRRQAARRGAPSKTTVIRLRTPALMSEPSRATGSVRSSSESTRVPSGIRAPASPELRPS